MLGLGVGHYVNNEVERVMCENFPSSSGLLGGKHVGSYEVFVPMAAIARTL